MRRLGAFIDWCLAFAITWHFLRKARRAREAKA
jgi:hypothetical protein